MLPKEEDIILTKEDLDVEVDDGNLTEEEFKELLNHVAQSGLIAELGTCILEKLKSMRGRKNG